ncbi:MAG: hypothetical protein ABW321_31640 [Polyangiales bacterium]
MQTPALNGGTSASPTGGNQPTAGAGDAPIPAGRSGAPLASAGRGAIGSAGSAGGQQQGPATSGAEAAPSGVIDPVGVWWTEVETPGSEVLPWVGQLDGTAIRFVMRVEVSGEAPNHTVKFDFCQLQTEWTDPMNAENITTIGFRPDTVAAFSESRTVDLGGLSAGSKVPLPSMAFLGGTDDSGNEVDENGDGNPAVTAWVRTLLGLEIEVYEQITINATLDLTAPDADTLTGTLDFAADATIVSSNNVIIASGTEVTITPDSKTVPLTAKRLPDGGDCSALPSMLKFTTVPPPPPPLLPPEEPAPAP